ncbi:bifunctional UDP-3-O-[3-hydroxymyristoyl] N-acetylglucosamine deacetylase/3-hydroxyacyl-ACP dehydratase [Weeksella virosa]|uniref:Multifunctional fusion protein n=1 Tax=Weeksella virosa (strain ATCC 43766 / DSM 16922 / JCM 21250 / CCUG 30538 / CDC 9751 / IAM 14551 / NBRC 16016 / NCTC 11634 / CL345/78) TaxID=865938 RepID=F0NZ90_WEEVC|nr:bifunctional UDP-3-O-[3-hydroxymyristoyl] N-acetylglucosamine deacetylase/3-hydroxyacyl-ACP dehydratase [Weeksella virosa]ADX67219.1 (3R)-hydroxymyristoyl-(acyl-carrier-protein)dehydratase [Weeksella virosa DSM 16922]MDK7675933.1 bifunctional UDP-3-O-[3-hydroxymyristoyl] N-acetylglucosamine deacetylase/3-hydroxyacyl-ACP dehydratase [Weeksella virosa]SUP53488.1 UDP-3-O-[3-hydroxymyristoyl] N-acetylglucosamine deacetylase [Weeksella virosa]VEH63045.1 UDP-3-O-[3-hydroxymyristoyl] N-acetylglucos
MADYQKTLAKEAVLEGVGLHTGKQVKLTFKPADVDTGFVFVRTDLEGNPQVEADAQYVVSTVRGTTLEKKGVKVHTTEHVLAALVGMDIDNCYIEIDNAEPPIMDGSSIFFVEAIENAGIVEQDKEREYFKIKEIVTFTDPETGSEITAIPADEYQITTMVDFGTKVLGTQNATLSSIKNFKEEIANSRTFCFLHELEQLLEAGLVKGGDLDNAIVYVDKEITPQTKERLCKAFNREDVSIKPNGILDHLSLHYPNEAARHKLLDVMGDLALIGTKLKAKIIASKPGHKINTNFAKKLNKQIKLAQRNKIPEFDLTKEPVYTINDIIDLLPHRPPFLLIDKVIEKTPTSLVGIKNVTMNEPFFVGHFPKEPVMPGVLQIEAMAQLGGLLVLGELDNPQEYSTYFMKIENAKFKQKVVPGDTLVFKMDLLAPIRRGIVHMRGQGYVNNTLAVEAEMMAVITKE